jgi:hypothetical protein
MTSELKHELHEVEETAEKGESAATPVILFGEVWIVCAIAVVVLLALVLIAYRLAT